MEETDTGKDRGCRSGESSVLYNSVEASKNCNWCSFTSKYMEIIFFHTHFISYTTEELLEEWRVTFSVDREGKAEGGWNS